MLSDNLHGLSKRTNNRKIWLNLQLTKKPVEHPDYVILHELAHLRVANHGKEFVAILDTHMRQSALYHPPDSGGAGAAL